MNKNNLILVAVALLLVIGGAWYIVSHKIEVETVSADTHVAGDYVIENNQKTIVKNGSKLSIDGNLVVHGELTCDGGPLVLAVGGVATIDAKVNCARPDATGSGIILYAKGGVTFGSDATVISNTSVQMVSDESKILTTQKSIDALYDEAGQNSGTGPRVGPFVEGGAAQSVKASAGVEPEKKETGFQFVKTAHAQVPRDNQGNAVPNVILSGHWYIGNGGNTPGGLQVPTPPKDIHKIVLNFNFGDKGNVELKDFYLIGPNGRDGRSDVGRNCNARGERGEGAFRMRVEAATIILNNFILQLGNGGNGGGAETKKDCDPGIARGGDGGEAGNFKMTAAGKIEIASFHIIPGAGGTGGSATASGKDGVDACPGTKGGDALATGGAGGKNKKELAAAGAVEGISNIIIDRVDGGAGGKATARPGKGGNGIGCKCNGGKGGNANSTGGAGGDASVKVVGGIGEAYGGDGGDADSHGGNGANGGSCPLAPSGGNGGNGGNAVSKEGKGGRGTSGDGKDGTVVDQTGGNGGNGGDGCGPGNGGKGGRGKPNGADGQPGAKKCPEPEKKTGVIVPPSGDNTTGTSGGGKSSTVKVQVIRYGNLYVPVSQLIQEGDHGPNGCRALHWHANPTRGFAVATNGTTVPDPGPPCGYGRVNETPVMNIDVSSNANY